MPIIQYSGEELLANPSVLTEHINSLSDAISELELTSGEVEGGVSVDTATGVASDTNGDVLFYLYRYIHLRFATSPSGAGFSNDPNSISGDVIYIGLSNSNDTTAPIPASSYIWQEFAWDSNYFVRFNVNGGGRIILMTTNNEDDEQFDTYTTSTGPIDLLNVAATGPAGQDAVDVRVQCWVPMTEDNAVFDPFTWTPTSPQFKNDEDIVKALSARIFIGGEETTDYSRYTFRWLKNSQNTYTPVAPQRAYSGNDKQVLIIGNDDVADGGTDLFICELMDI